MRDKQQQRRCDSGRGEHPRIPQGVQRPGDVQDLVQGGKESKEVEPPKLDDVLAIGVDQSLEERSILCLPPKTILNTSLSEV